MKKQNGFSAVEAIVIVIIIAVVAGVGFIAYGHLTKKDAEKAATAGQAQSSDAAALGTQGKTVFFADQNNPISNGFENFLQEFVAAGASEKPTANLQAVLTSYGATDPSGILANLNECMQNFPASISVDAVTAQANGSGVSYTGTTYTFSTSFNYKSSDNVPVTFTANQFKDGYTIVTARCGVK